MRTWQTIRAASYPRHAHAHAYAALVLSGEYVEAGDLGRFRVQAGDVVIHDRFEAHLNHFSGRGAVVLNLALQPNASLKCGLIRVADFDRVIRTAERSQREAAQTLFENAQSVTPPSETLSDELARTLRESPSHSITRWSASHGCTPWKTSREFHRLFGITPVAFRARARARLAWRSIQTTDEPMANIAARLGFSDQSHMVRSVRSLTGMSPRSWRPANRFKTA